MDRFWQPVYPANGLVVGSSWLCDQPQSTRLKYTLAFRSPKEREKERENGDSWFEPFSICGCPRLPPIVLMGSRCIELVVVARITQRLLCSSCRLGICLYFNDRAVNSENDRVLDNQPFQFSLEYTFQSNDDDHHHYFDCFNIFNCFERMWRAVARLFAIFRIALFSRPLNKWQLDCWWRRLRQLHAFHALTAPLFTSLLKSFIITHWGKQVDCFWFYSASCCRISSPSQVLAVDSSFLTWPIYFLFVILFYFFSRPFFHTSWLPV